MPKAKEKHQESAEPVAPAINTPATFTKLVRDAIEYETPELSENMKTRLRRECSTMKKLQPKRVIAQIAKLERSRRAASNKLTSYAGIVARNAGDVFEVISTHDAKIKFLESLIEEKAEPKKGVKKIVIKKKKPEHIDLLDI